MTFVEKLRNRMRRELFQPSLLGFFLSSDYIIRRGLFCAIRNLAPTISGEVLDFGCGSKPYRDLFSKATDYLGVDLQDTGHDHKDSQIDVFYDGRVLPFADCTFDAVVSFEVFEHVFDLPPVLREINRVTRGGGFLMISIPFAWPEHEIPYDFARYTSFGIGYMLKEGGYDIVEIRKTTSHVLAAAQIVIAYLRPKPQRHILLRYVQQIGIVFPCTLIAHLADALLPKNYEYFCNTVVLAKKRASSG